MMFVRQQFTATSAFRDCLASELGVNNKLASFFLVNCEGLLKLGHDVNEA
jgi:hypothetical protein